MILKSVGGDEVFGNWCYALGVGRRGVSCGLGEEEGRFGGTN